MYLSKAAPIKGLFSWGGAFLKVILSTLKIKDIQTELLKSRNIPEVHDIIMTLPYFCFLSIDKKQNMESVRNEIELYFSAFNHPLNIYAMHNEYFYELDGVNRLNFFDYFRNIVQKNKDIIIPNNIKLFSESIINKIQKNNFNKNEILSLEEKRLG